MLLISKPAIQFAINTIVNEPNHKVRIIVNNQNQLTSVFELIQTILKKSYQIPYWTCKGKYITQVRPANQISSYISCVGEYQSIRLDNGNTIKVTEYCNALETGEDMLICCSEIFKQYDKYKHLTEQEYIGVLQRNNWLNELKMGD